jgi:hypothetical protein
VDDGDGDDDAVAVPLQLSVPLAVRVGLGVVMRHRRLLLSPKNLLAVKSVEKKQPEPTLGPLIKTRRVPGTPLVALLPVTAQPWSKLASLSSKTVLSASSDQRYIVSHVHATCPGSTVLGKQ